MSKSPLLQFVHVTDPHWGEPYGHIFLPAADRALCLMQDLAHLTPSPSFALVTGDVTEWGFARADQLAIGADQLKQMPLPTYFVPGNHDLTPGPTPDDPTLPPIEQTNWHRCFGEAGLFWSVVEGPLELIGFAMRSGDPDGILDRLAAQLAQPPRGRRVLVSHYPIYPTRDGGILANWGPDAIGESAERLQTLLAAHAETVTAYLYGHIHALAAHVHDKVLHVAGAPVSAGAPGYRLFSVYEEGITCRFVPLSNDALVTYDFWGLINPDLATSPQYPTRELYHKGQPLERDFYFDFATRTLQATMPSE